MARRLAMTLLGNGSGDFDPTDTDGPRLEGIFCANCGRGNASKTCGRCMAQAYCSTECQRADWKRHKASCQSVEDLEASADAAKAAEDPSRVDSNSPTSFRRSTRPSWPPPPAPSPGSKTPPFF